MAGALSGFLARFSRLFRKPTLPHPSPVAILTFLSDQGDRSVVEKLSSRHDWQVNKADSIEQARSMVLRAEPHVVLLDREVVEDWRSVVSALSEVAGNACIVLVSRVVDEGLWNEVVRNGGYDVLAKPLTEDQVLRTVRLARSYWNSAHHERTFTK